MPNNPFWAWVDEGEVPTLVIDGVIDTGTDWYSDAVTPRAFRAALDAYAGRDILVSINSPGGDVFAGFEIYNLLAQRSGGVTVRVMGLAGSAASYIAMAADPGKLQMCRASMMMIHLPWSGGTGNADDLRAQAAVLDEIGEIMTDIYMQRATCSREALQAMLRAERYLSPTEAQAFGLCDAIVDAMEEDGEDAAAAAMRGRYAAMTMSQVKDLRKTLMIRSPRARQETEEDTTDYLAMADALIADM